MHKITNKIISLIYWYFKFNFLNKKTSKPNIGLVVNSFDKGGMETVALKLYKGYSQRGYKSFIISETNKVGELAKKLEYPNHLRIINGDLNEMLKFCYENNIRILHYHYNTFHLKFFRAIKFKTLYTIHNTYLWFNDEDWIEYTKKLKNCDALIAVSDWVKEYFSNKSKINKKIHTIENGIDTNIYNGQIKTNFKRKDFGLSKSDFVLLNLASINEAKYQIFLIGMMEKIIKKTKKIKLIIVGNILSEAYYAKFKECLDKSKAKKYIKYINYIESQFVGSFLKTIPNALILPSIYEGQPQVVNECRFCNLPVIMTNLFTSKHRCEDPGIITIPTPYKNILNITMNDVYRISTEKIAINLEEAVTSVFLLKENYTEIKNRKIPIKTKRKYYINTMVNKYIKIIESINH